MTALANQEQVMVINEARLMCCGQRRDECTCGCSKPLRNSQDEYKPTPIPKTNWDAVYNQKPVATAQPQDFMQERKIVRKPRPSNAYPVTNSSFTPKPLPQIHWYDLS